MKKHSFGINIRNFIVRNYNKNNLNKVADILTLWPTIIKTITDMILTETKYYFSIKSMIFVTLFFGGIATLVLSVSIKLVQESLIWSIAFATPLIVIIVSLPDYLRFLYCTLINRPALELTKELLINNTKGEIYKWTDIKEIVYKKFTGLRPPPGGYIEIVFLNSEKKVQLPNNSIKCKTKDLLKDLQQYLRNSKMCE